jgi:hypothetical protein
MGAARAMGSGRDLEWDVAARDMAADGQHLLAQAIAAGAKLGCLGDEAVGACGARERQGYGRRRRSGRRRSTSKRLLKRGSSLAPWSTATGAGAAETMMACARADEGGSIEPARSRITASQREVNISMRALYWGPPGSGASRNRDGATDRLASGRQRADVGRRTAAGAMPTTGLSAKGTRDMRQLPRIATMFW